MSAGSVPSRGGAQVSTIELFFDLVFVFTVTQVALIIEEHPGWDSVAQAGVELAVIFWMYGGFAWLTNTLGVERARQRLILLLGMAALLLVSLAVPRAFGEDAVAFGWAYLALNVVHLSGFLVGNQAPLRRAMLHVGARNLTAALLIVIAGYVEQPWRWIAWVAAVLVHWPSTLLSKTPGRFRINAAHFGERHGLMIIIVLGESLVSVALAAQDLPVTLALALGTLAGLACSAALWWCYFAHDDERAVEAFARRGPAANALLLYDLPHMLMMGGIIAVAAGSRLSLPDLLHPTDLAAAVLIAAGAGLYLAALALFRALLGFDQPWSRLVAAVAVGLTAPIGTASGAAQQLAGVAVIIVAMLVIERRFPGRAREARLARVSP